MGWSIVPPTILRDGPAGRGMVQLWLDVDLEVDVLQLILTRDNRLRRFVVFDALVNNADRKGGHMDPKLRTVLWGWKGEALDEEEIHGVWLVREALDGALGAGLRDLLDPLEVEITCERAERLLRDPIMPSPDATRHAIPWPPF
jgi:hypothetical protein